jgi:hypothetical protein
MSQDTEVLTGTIEGEGGLVSLPQGVTLLQVFTEPERIDPLLARIAEEARKLQADPYTEAGRKAIASMAYKIARAKSHLDGLGKDLVAEMKELPKKVDASRKRMRDFCDELKDEVRKPLDDWEAEQERIAAERKAQEEAAALGKEILFIHEIALLQNAEFDRKKAEAAQAAEQARIEREDQLRREGEERATREAQEREQAAKEAQERAERQQAEAEQRAKDAEARAAQAQKEADERAEQAAIEARQREQDRQAALARAEAEKRAAAERDMELRRSVNNEIVQALLALEVGLTESQAKEIVKGLAQGRLPRVSIAYHQAAA